MTIPTEQRKHEHWIARILAGGVWTSAILLVTGLLVAVFGNGPAASFDRSPGLAEVIHGLTTKSFYSGNASSGATIMYLGLIALILTPFVRVLTAAVTFILERDWRYVVVSLLVFFALIGELVFAYH